MQGNNPHGIRQKKHVRRIRKTKSKSSWKEIRGCTLEPQKIHFKITTKCWCGKPRVKFFCFLPPNPFNHRTHYMCSKALYTSNSIQREAQQSFCGVWRPGEQGDAHCLESTNICLTQLGSPPPTCSAIHPQRHTTFLPLLYIIAW